MNESMHIPKPPLSHFIRFFFYFEDVQKANVVDRFLPNGDTEILIDFHDEPQYIYDNATLKEVQACRHVWASGVRTGPITIPSGNNSSMMVIMFRKGGAAPFFPFPMSEMADRVFDADLVWGTGFGELRERLLATRAVARRFEIVENFLTSMFRSRLEANPCVEFAVNEMATRPDSLSILKMNQKIGYSQKHFIELFKRQVGVTPKAYLKLMRFQKTIRFIDASPPQIDWKGIAADCGFYDQSHFINDFKHFTGFTPEHYASIHTEYQNYVPVD